MGTKHTILISPRDGRTAVIENLGSGNAHTQATVSLDGRTVTLGDYLARFPATEFAVADSLDDAATALTAAKDRSYTLDFLLMLFDQELSTSLKHRAADELDELLACEANRNYVLDIVLSQPLPNDTDFNAAKLLGRKNGATQQLVGVLEATRQRAEFAFHAWLAIRRHPMVTQFGSQLVRAKLIQSGIVRRVVTELTTRQRAHELRGSVAMTAQSHLDGRIVVAFLNEYQGLLPEGVHVAASPGVKRATNIAAHTSRAPERASTQFTNSGRSAVEEQQRAVAEVDKIAELFLEDRDETAVQYRNELVERQANHSDHSHLVKSLCHIASKCSDGGRNDAAFECLNVALQYENGVDSRLFVQLGNLFKDLRRFENATECFRNALRSADSSSDRDLINRELARLLVARGEYPEALRAFRELSDIDVAPESRTSLATLHRKMGHFADARRIYNDVWSNYRSHQAFSGLAEVNRQSGRIDKAIRKYRFLLQRPEIESRSRKVYTMALSSLLCTSGSLDAAENVLQPLLQTHRNDASVQLAMAKIFRLRGDLKQADTLYESARFRIEETERWASQLYETARMAVCTANEIRTVEQPGPCVSLPEYQTLSECNSLLRRILRRDWDGYQPPAAPSTGPFKIHSDFSSVLRYHTKLLIGGPFSLIDQHRVNRIRRRGLVPLRAAVRALDSSDFDAAIQYECEMCLKAA